MSLHQIFQSSKMDESTSDAVASVATGQMYGSDVHSFSESAPIAVTSTPSASVSCEILMEVPSTAHQLGEIQQQTPISGITPKKKKLRRRLGWNLSPIVKRLPTPKRPQKQPWKEKEAKALVQFVALHRDLQCNDGTEWPGMRETDPYWVNASTWVAETAGTTRRIAGSIRSKVNKLRGIYDTIDDAEQAYGLGVEHYSTESTYQSIDVASPLKTSKFLLQQLSHLSAEQQGQVLEHTAAAVSPELLSKTVLSTVSSLPVETIVTLMSDLFDLVQKQNSETSTKLLDSLVHKNLSQEGFVAAPSLISLNTKAMKTLQQSGKNPYLVVKFAQCISCKRPGSTESLMPLHRMPFGLIEYQVDFFTSSCANQVREPEDFRLWRESMSNELHGRQDRILRGPMWSGCPSSDVNNPLKAKVNVACVGPRTLQKRNASSTVYTTTPVIQTAAISALSKTSKRVWLKADGTDMKVALQESKTGVWNGDVDLGDGKLAALSAEYDARLSSLTFSQTGLQQSIDELVQAVALDMPFLQNGLTKAQTTYHKKLNQESSTQQSVLDACWEVAEFNILLNQANSLHQLLGQVQNMASQETRGQSIKRLSPDFERYLTNLFKKKREPATHILVIMASDEERRHRPFSVPVQYVPYRSIRDQYIRDLTSDIKRELTDAGIHVVGTVTDGEFCSLRSQGATRPLHVWQLVHDAKQATQRMKAGTLENMLFPVGVSANGVPVLRVRNPAIPATVAADIVHLQTVYGFSRQDCVAHLREQLVPQGFEPYPFRRNSEESHLDRMRSLVATYIYRNAVAEWQLKGIDFGMYLYVPEADEITGKIHHERSDHGHLLKRIAAHTREVRYPALQRQPFEEAMLDETTRLTYPALVGQRKQSVADAERLLSYHVADFLERNGNLMEERYVRTIAGWHEATDGRGLSELERCRLNYKMLQYVCQDLMPWYDVLPDFTYLDINRPMDNIRGFSRETFVEVTTNIESQEWRRREAGRLGPEHPRASTSDDCESFFSLCHQYLGLNFTLRDFTFCWQKLVREFTKKMDPALPFFYWTPSERYREEEPDYNEGQAGQQRLHHLRLSHREDSSVFSAGRQYIPARDRQTIRQQVHRFDVGLPPVPRHLLPQMDHNENMVD